MTSASGSDLNEKNLGSWLLILEANKSITGLNLKCFNISLKMESFNFHSVLVSGKKSFLLIAQSQMFLTSVSHATGLQLLILFIL